ncbi:MAG: YeiH family putative sulfate export transporter [Nevskia sp.]|nr:YeiH family putative sulfate export transporter [Nevskia sp.]
MRIDPLNPKLQQHLAGIALCAAVATAAIELSQWAPLAHFGLGALTLAIVLGIALGNLAPAALHQRTAAGIMFSQRTLLRLGVALYGVRLTLQQVSSVGLTGIVTDVLVIASTLAVGLWIGTRWLKLDRDTALLIATGSAICGAAAVMAAEPVVRAPAHKVAVAVATVTIFGTAAIAIYPLLYPLAGLSSAQFGTYIGSTVHEVSQVVAAGNAVSPAVADQAVIIKLIRVLMLAPFLLLIGRLAARGADTAGARKTPLVPGFVLLFGIVIAVNSLGLIAPSIRSVLLGIDNLLLAVAMAALGWSTRVGMLRQAGLRPLLLGAAVFGFLLGGGYAINRAVALLLS